MPIPIIGGVNLLNDSRSIRDDQCVKSKNLIPVRPGVLGKRPGLSFGLQALRLNASYLDGETVVWNTIPIPFESGLAFAGWIDKYMYSSGSGSLLVASGPDSANAITSELPGGSRLKRRPVLVAFNNKIYAFAGYPDVFNKVIQSSSGSGFEIVDFTFSGTGNGSLSPGVAAVYKNRMVYGNFGPGYENHIVFSDRYEPQTIGDDALAANGPNIIVGARDGDRLVAFHEVTMTQAGSPAQSVFLVLKEFSGYLLAGEPSESDDLENFLGTLEVNKFNVACGCVSPATIADTPFGTIWCGPDDVWFMPTGGVPYPIGTNIRPLIKNQPRNVQYKLFGAYYDGFYRLALFGEGQGPSDDNAPAEHWWLDLRNGVPRNAAEAQWWGPQQYVPLGFKAIAQPNLYDPSTEGLNPTEGPWGFVLETRPSRDKQLYAVMSAWADGRRLPDLSGDETYALVLASVDGTSVYDTPSFIASLGPEWAASTAYEVGDNIVALVEAVPGSFLPFTFTVTTAGTSYAAEPTWAVGTVSDGSVTWTSGPLVPLVRFNFENEVSLELVTKEYDGGDSYTQKLYSGVELDVAVSAPTRIKVETIVNGGSSTTEATEDIVPEGWTLGSTQMDATLSRKFDMVALHPADGARVIGNTVQFRITDVPGYMITENNNSLTFVHESPQGSKTVSLTEGLYDTLADLLDHVVAQMSAAMTGGITFTHNMSDEPEFDEQLVKITCSSGLFTLDHGASTASSNLLDMLGFLPTVSTPAAATQVAQVSVPGRCCALVDIGNINILTQAFRRRPL